jgi:hypothetical protein
MLLLFTASLALAQTEFSAEIVDNHKTDASHARIYFGKDKLRIEPAQKDARGGGAVIMNLSSHTFTVLMDQQHMYMEMPSQMMEQRNTYDFFRIGDAENACAEWLAQDRNKGGSCHKVGSDTVNGRNTVKYEGTDAKGEAGAVWIDPKLRFPVKWQGKKGSGELRDIQEASQPASMFEVPAGYTKFDMGNMMQRPQ